jgi:hypothetical protein
MRRYTEMKGCQTLTDDEMARVNHALRWTYAVCDRARCVLGVKTAFRISELLSFHIGDMAARLVDGRGWSLTSLKDELMGDRQDGQEDLNRLTLDTVRGGVGQGHKASH